MRVVGVPRNDMPMHMRHLVAETGEIDLEWRETGAHGALQRENAAHQVVAVGDLEIGHFGRVRLPDDAAETRVIGIIDTNDTTAGVLPQHRLIGRVAQRAWYGRGVGNYGAPGLWATGVSMP